MATESGQTAPVPAGGVEHNNGDSHYENMEEADPLPSTSFATPSYCDNELTTEYEMKNLPPWDMKVFITNDRPVAFGVHIDIFMMASPVFERMIACALKDGNNCVELQIDSEVFKIIKSFMYTNRLPDQLDMGMALELLDASVLYEIDLLLPRISEKIKASVTGELALKVLETCRRLELTDLEAYILAFIRSHGSTVLNAEEFAELGCYDAIRILSSDFLVCREVEVYHAALSWSFKKATHSSDFKKGIAYYFNKLIQCVRFPLMSPAELAKIVVNAPSYIFEAVDLLALFKYVCLPEDMKNKISVNFVSKKRSTGVSDRSNSTSSVIMTSQETQTERESLCEVGVDPINFEGLKSCSESNDNNLSIPTPTPSPRPVGEDVTKTHNPRKRPYPVDMSSSLLVGTPPVANSPATRRRLTAQEDPDDLFHRIIKVESKPFEGFEELFRKYYRDSNSESIGSMLFKDVRFEYNHRPLLVKNCKEFVLDVNLETITNPAEDDSNFKDFVKTFDPMRYLLCDTKMSKNLTPENVWSLEQDITLKFNGVTFVKIRHKEAEISLNYVFSSCRFLSNNKLKPKKLAMSNCEFSIKALRDRGKQLEKLILYRVWGEFTMEEIMKDFPKLTELICWKYVPQSWITGSSASIPLCLNFGNSFPAKAFLRKLVLYQTELKFPARCNNAVTTVSELFLERCHCKNMESGSRVANAFKVIFPRLKKLRIVEENGVPGSCGNLAIPDVINCVRSQLTDIEYIEVIGMKWPSMQDADTDRSQDEALKEFLSQIVHRDRPLNFQLEKSNGMWEGKSHDEAQQESTDVDGGYWSTRDEIEFQWYSVDNFYDKCEIFEDYFIQGSVNNGVFPRPVLW